MKHLTFALLTLFVTSACSLFAQTMPGQPASGPAAREYLHASMSSSGPFWAAGHAGDDAFRYYIFEPSNPKPASAPVVLFLHGWLAYTANEYIFWISHLVLRGHTVVWAQYDRTIFIPFNWASNATEVWHDALDRLSDPRASHVRPERNIFGKVKNAIIGHSAGGYLSALVAVRSSRSWNALPTPDVVAAFEPAGKGLIPGDDFTRIPASTKVLIVNSQEDQISCSATGLSIWNSLGHIASENKDYLFVQSDSHGNPALIADHYYPNNTGRMTDAMVDARDYFVTFKLSAAALNCAFRGTDCNVAFGKGKPEQVTMGKWSDGVDVKPILWLPDPSNFPMSAACLAKEGGAQPR